jgi:hypothetical protein
MLQASSATGESRIVQPVTEAWASSASLGRLNACPTLPGNLQSALVGQAVSPAKTLMLQASRVMPTQPGTEDISVL